MYNMLSKGFVFLIGLWLVNGQEKYSLTTIKMPGVMPTKNNTYLCTSLPLHFSREYVVEIQPHLNVPSAHHLVLMTCKKPKRHYGDHWNCNEITKQGGTGNICEGRNLQIIYASSKNGKKFELPTDVSFSVGKRTIGRNLVLQVYYENIPKTDDIMTKDYTSVTMKSIPHRTHYKAAVYFVQARGIIPPHTITYWEAACAYKGRKTLEPFAYRVHTNSHGRVVSGYRVRNGIWTEIGRMDPNKGETFHDVTTKNITIERNDVIAVRCTYDNRKGSDSIFFGPSPTENELCNFNIMYKSTSAPSQMLHCEMIGQPYTLFKFQMRPQLKNVPVDASTDPMTNINYPATPILKSEYLASLKQLIRNSQ